jgi:hypothetical protein
MRTKAFWIAALLSAFPALVFSQSYTTVVATNISNATGTPLASGILNFYGTNSSGTQITYTPSGGSPITAGTPVQCTVTSGAVSGCQVANQATASPAGLFYNVVVTDSGGSLTYLSIPLVVVTGSTFNFNSYALSSSQVATGYGPPFIACNPSAGYTESLYNPYGQNWYCVAGSIWQQNPPAYSTGSVLVTGPTAVLGFSATVSGPIAAGISMNAPDTISLGNGVWGDHSAAVYAGAYYGDGSHLTGVGGGGGMVYPGPGIAVSTGSAWASPIVGVHAGDIFYYTGSAYAVLTGNASGTQWLQETASGVPSWTIPSGGGNVSNSGTPAQYQFPAWVTSTTIEGIGPCAVGYPLVGGGSSAYPNCSGTVVFLTGTAGVAGTTTGVLHLANATGANLTSIEAGASAPALTYVMPTVAPTASQILSAAAPSAGVSQLSWTTAAGGGNVSNSGTPTQYQFPAWVNATTIEGIGPCTLDYPIVGAGNSAYPNCNGTIALASIVGGPNSYSGGELPFASTGSSLAIGISTASTGSPSMDFDHRAASNTGTWLWRNGSSAGSTEMSLSAIGVLGVASVYAFPATSPDTGISRDGSAGIIDIGNGTAGDKSGSWNALEGNLGTAGTSTGVLAFGNATGANVTSFSAGASAPSLTYLFPTAAPTAGQLLSAAAPSSSVSQLSWVTGSGGSTTYTSPGTSAVSVTSTNQFTSINNNVINYGAYCDGVWSGGSYKGHDDHSALAAAFSAAGSNGIGEITLPAAGLPSGPTGAGTTTGICLSSTTQQIGNGSSSLISTQNGFTIKGQGGHQKPYPGAGQIEPAAGTSVIAYCPGANTSTSCSSSPLGTTPFITVAGPIHAIVLDGIAADCNQQGQTCWYFPQISKSYVRDISAMNFLQGTNPWNAGIWISAYESDFSAGEFGTQQNTFERLQAITSATYSSRSGIMIGCQDSSSCVGTGTNNATDVSANHFIDLDIDMGGDTAHGVVWGYMDSNRFDYGTFSAFNSLYILNESGSSFPAGNIWDGFGLGGATAYMTGTATLSGNINSSTCSIGTNWTSNIPTPSLTQIANEVILVSSQSGGSITGCTRGYRGSVATTHSSGDHLGAPIGFIIDGTSTTPSVTNANNLFPNIQTNFGCPVGGGGCPASYQSQLSANVYGVAGSTSGGFKFNSQSSSTQSTPLGNELFGVETNFSAATAVGTTFSTLGINKTIPPSLLSQPGTVIHIIGKMAAVNNAGTTIGVVTGFQLTDTSSVNVTTPATGAFNMTSAANGTITYDVYIVVSQQPTLSTYIYNVIGTMTYDDGTNTGTITSEDTRNFGSGLVTGRSISSGLEISPGGYFSSATGSSTLQSQSMMIFIYVPDGSSVIG